MDEPAHAQLMKDKAPIIVLVIVAVGLLIALLVVNNKRAEENEKADSSIQTLSKTVNSIQGKLTDQESVNRTLETNLAQTTADYSNKLASRDAQIASTQADLAKTQSDAKAAADASAA